MYPLDLPSKYAPRRGHLDGRQDKAHANTTLVGDARFTKEKDVVKGNNEAKNYLQIILMDVAAH